MSIGELAKGDEFIGFVACVKSRVDTASNKKQYCDATLFDGNDEILGKIWDHDGPAPIEDTILKVKGVVDEYRGNKQLKILQWRQTEAKDNVEPANFLPVTPLDRQWLFQELMDAIQSIEDEDYKKIVTHIYGNSPDAVYNAPSANAHHHAYLSGNMEHTLYVLHNALRHDLRHVNRDLLIAGCLLHDIGKVRAYDWSGCTIKMSREGRLLDHIAIGLQMLAVCREVLDADIDPLKYELLGHMIASHHGKLEWGSPIEPVCKEAIILHNADVMDALMWRVDKVIEDTKEDSDWTGKVKGMRFELFARTK